MNIEDLELIDYELVVFIRRSSLDKELGGMDRSSYTLLTQLSKTNGSSGVKALAEEFHLDISTISRQMSVLEAKGLVERLPNVADGRSSHFQVTDEGKRKLAAAKEARMARLAVLLSEWTEEEHNQFGELLRRLNRTFIE